MLRCAGSELPALDKREYREIFFDGSKFFSIDSMFTWSYPFHFSPLPTYQWAWVVMTIYNQIVLAHHAAICSYTRMVIPASLGSSHIKFQWNICSLQLKVSPSSLVRYPSFGIRLQWSASKLRSFKYIYFSIKPSIWLCCNFGLLETCLCPSIAVWIV